MWEVDALGRKPMLVVTTETLPGFEIKEIIGGVVGATARPLNVFTEGVKALTPSVKTLSGRAVAPTTPPMISLISNPGSVSVVTTSMGFLPSASTSHIARDYAASVRLPGPGRRFHLVGVAGRTRTPLPKLPRQRGKSSPLPRG